MGEERVTNMNDRLSLCAEGFITLEGREAGTDDT